MENPMSKRIELIDIAKGVSIILVAFNHSKLKYMYPDFNNALGLFRMPLFFFLAGVFFSEYIKPKEFLFKKTDALLKPYFVTLFSLFLFSVVLGDKNLWEQLIGIFYGNGDTIRWAYLWFLTHLWLVFFVTYVLFRYTGLRTRSNLIKMVVISAMLVVGPYFLGTFWHRSISISGREFTTPGLPFSFDMILITMAFFMSGIFLNEKAKKFTPRSEIFLITSIIFILIVTNTQASMDLNIRVYRQPLFTTIAAICGIYLIMSISYYLAKGRLSTKIFALFGSASLFVLIFHGYIGEHTYEVISRFSAVESQLLLAILAFLASIIGPLFIRKAVMQSNFLTLFYFPLWHNKKSKFAARVVGYLDSASQHPRGSGVHFSGTLSRKKH